MTQENTETTQPERFDPRKLRSIFDIIQDLSKPIARKYLESKRKGNTDIVFISWHNATKLLDYYANGWSFEVKEIMNFAGKVCIIARIGIPCLEGMVWRESSGNEQEDLDTFGDAFVNSESQALRRAAAKFGLARDLYPTNPVNEQFHRKLYPQLYAGNQTSPVQNAQQPPPQNNPANTNPANVPPNAEGANAKPPENSPANQSRSGGPTPAQLKFIEDLSVKNNISEVDVCDRFSNGEALTFDSLTKAQVQSAINWLKELPKQS